ncbi:unnamed protein product, partial [Arabidopsis halleri]
CLSSSNALYAISVSTSLRFNLFATSASTFWAVSLVKIPPLPKPTQFSVSSSLCFNLFARLDSAF